MNGIANAMDFKWAKGFTPENGYPALDTSNNVKLMSSIVSRRNAIYDNYFVHGVGLDRDELAQSIVGSPHRADDDHPGVAWR